MLFHLSIDARNPRHVAAVLAELFGSGAVHPFPPVADGSWLAMAGDDRNTMIEVYPQGTVLEQASGDADAFGRSVPQEPNGLRHATHFAMATPLTAEQVLEVARREGWPAKYRKRGGLFGVIEMWIEGERMIEVLTPEMQQEYLATMSVQGWQTALQAAPA
ncbi:hypothetical protein [Altericroceibacterium xinjiangense]|uniref:hypothetical protein n=1 Tax=Altericroceibacterium xinjiangense TaxID=762261 RepID=UPI000F7D9B6D|nr:hypothetical protein [Altericroceibacterium xinjiangense]